LIHYDIQNCILVCRHVEKVEKQCLNVAYTGKLVVCRFVYYLPTLYHLQTLLIHEGDGWTFIYCELERL